MPELWRLSAGYTLKAAASFMNIVIAAEVKENYIKQIVQDETLHRYTWVNDSNEFPDFEEADAFIDFNEEMSDYGSLKKPLLLNQTSGVLDNIQCNRKLTGRFSGWPGFGDRASWEIAVGPEADIEALKPLMQAIGKEMIVVHDTVGLIAPRVLCTIINEACYAINEGITDAAQIDIAMRLGTNYPDGPVNWGKRIGASRIAELLNTLSVENDRYKPHASLLKLLA